MCDDVRLSFVAVTPVDVRVCLEYPACATYQNFTDMNLWFKDTYDTPCVYSVDENATTIPTSFFTNIPSIGVLSLSSPLVPLDLRCDASDTTLALSFPSPCDYVPWPGKDVVYRRGGDVYNISFVAPSPSTSPYDFDGDGVFRLADAVHAAFAIQYHSFSRDLNEDGDVDVLDAVFVANQWVRESSAS